MRQRPKVIAGGRCPCSLAVHFLRTRELARSRMCFFVDALFEVQLGQRRSLLAVFMRFCLPQASGHQSTCDCIPLLPVTLPSSCHTLGPLPARSSAHSPSSLSSARAPPLAALPARAGLRRAPGPLFGTSWCGERPPALDGPIL